MGMNRICLGVSILLLAGVASAREAAVVATGSPYASGKLGQCNQRETSSFEESCTCPVQGLSLPPSLALQGLRVQTDDAFLRLEKRHVAGQDIQLYHFKQPRRLSNLELPFKILPLRRIDLDGVRIVEVPPQQALDSWFPGYAWSILVCTRCEEGLHLGWKFTPTSTQGAEPFYALIVDTVDGDEEVRAGVPQDLGLLAGLRVVGQPLAAIGLAAASLSTAAA